MTNQKLSEELGINTTEVAEKCSKYTMILVESLVKTGDVKNENLIAFIKENFTYNELVYTTLCYITEKANKILKEPEALEAMKAAIEVYLRQKGNL